METRKFIIGEKKIDVNVDTENKQVYLSQRGMCDLYNLKRQSVSRYVNTYANNLGKSISIGEAINHRPTTYYNQDIILQVGYKCNIEIANRFKEWVDTLFKDNNDIDITKNWLNGANNYEIVKFESGEISLDVNVSPQEDTVWLSVIDMSILFDRDSKTIYAHIKNIFDEKELEEKSNSCFLRIANSDKLVKYYNIDVVISVGYRVKSKRGIEFRRWATNVLKQYLIKGYAINNKRCIEHSDILISISNDISLINSRLSSIDNRLDDHDRLLEKINASEVLTDGTLVYEGNIYEAYYFIKHLFSMAKNRLIIIDGYINDSVLEMLNDVNVDIIIYTYPSAPLKNIDIQKFSINHSLMVIKQNSIHSRYIIVDDVIYSISESIKDAGSKRFVSQIIDIITVEDLLAGMH